MLSKYNIFEPPRGVGWSEMEAIVVSEWNGKSRLQKQPDNGQTGRRGEY
jgi:hypothetical protein